MPAGDYIEGLLLFGALLGATLGGAHLIVSARLGGLRGADRIVVYGLVATAGVLAIHVVPLALGILGRGSVLVASTAWLAAAIALNRAVPVRETAAPEPRPPADDPVWLRGVAALSIGLVSALVLSQLADRLTEASLAIDVLNFHMPGVVSWIETGSLWQIDVFLPDVAPGHYPNNGDVVLLAVALPWHNDFLTHLAMYPYYALTGVATFALARELGARDALAAVAACVVLAVPAVAAPALAAGLVDAMMLFGFAAGLLFTVRHWRRGETWMLVLAGLAFGIAFGTKWYAVSSVTIVIAVWIAASLISRRGWGRTAREAGVLIALIALAGGIWMLRNLVESGNPVFPVRVAPFGLEIFDAPPDTVRENAGFTLLDYIGEGGVAWSDFIWPQLRNTLAGPAILIGMAFVAGLLSLWRRRAGGGARLFGVLAVTAVLLFVAYLATPYSAGGPEGLPVLTGADARYAVPSLLVAAMVGVAGTLWGPRAGMVAGVLALAAILDGARYSAGASVEAASLDPVVWIPAVGVIAAIAFWRPVGELVRAAGTRRLALAGAAIAAVVALGGYEVQQRYNEDRFAGVDPALDYLLAAGEGHRVALAGVWDDAGISPVLPAFGPGFGNEVEYVGRNSEDMLRRYQSRAEFAAALGDGGYDFVIVGNGRLEDPDVPELEWSASVGYEQVAASDRLTLLAVTLAP